MRQQPGCPGLRGQRRQRRLGVSSKAKKAQQLSCNSAFVCVLLLVFLFAGCQTTPIPPMRGGGKTVSGQVQVATQKISLIGEFTARYSPNEFQCEVSKGPGVPLIMVHTVGKNLVRIEGGGKTFQGNPLFAPSFLRSWIDLKDVFGGHPDPRGCRVERVGRKLVVDYPKRNDRFVFLLDTGSLPTL